MRTLAFDTETYPINERGKASTKIVPRLVCLSFADDEGSGVLERERAVPYFLDALEDSECILVGANVSYDIAVMVRAVREEYGRDLASLIFKEYSEGRIRDIQIREQLRDVAKGGIFRRGGYSLADLVKRLLGKKVEGKHGPDVWRLRYNELEGRRAEDYPVAAYEYARMDAVYTRDVYRKQPESVRNEHYQACADWMLHCIAAWGVMTDLEWAQKIDAYYAREEDKHRRVLERHKIIVDGTAKLAAKRKLIEESFAELGEPPIKTPTGQTGTAAEVLEYLEEKGVEHPVFQALIMYNRATHYRATYLEPVLDAAEAGEPLCPRYNVLKNTGRCSSSKPNIQNFMSRLKPAEQAAIAEFVSELDEADDLSKDEIQYRRVMDAGVITGPDVRGCIVPRKGKVFVAADYKAAEMAALAQVCRNAFGRLTPLGEAINEGRDLHCMVAANLTGRTYEECVEAHLASEAWVKRPRDIGKVYNFAAPVGASVETIQGQARDQGLKLTLEEAQRAYDAWKAAWTEMDDYHKYVSAMQRSYGGSYYVEQHGPNGATSGWRLRVTSKFTEAANSLFQGLVGDGAKYAGWLLAKACYVEKDSPLHGARVIAMIHDEYVVECDEDVAEDVGAELSRLMVAGLKQFCPDIQIEADYSVMRKRWGK